MEILGQLEVVEERYEKLNELLSDPEVVSDTKKLMEYSKEQRSIEKTVAVFREYKNIVQQIADTKELLEIEEDKEMNRSISVNHKFSYWYLYLHYHYPKIRALRNYESPRYKS